MHGSSAHVSYIFALVVAWSCTVHSTRIVPYHQVALLLPFDADDVLALRRVLIQDVSQAVRLVLPQALDMVDMARYV